MKNYFKLTVGLLLAFVFVFTTCFAAGLDSYTIDDATSILTIEGTPEGAKVNDGITIQILRAGKTEDDVDEFYTDADKLAGDFVLFTQVPADENGAYKETVSLSGEEPGFYEVRVNGEHAGDVYFCTPAHKTEIVDNIKSNCSSLEESAAVAYLKENFALYTAEGEPNERSVWLNSFNVDTPLIFEVTEDGLFEVFVTMADELTIDNFKDNMTLAAYIAAFDEDKTNIDDAKSIFNFDEKYLSAYEERLSDELKADFVGENFKDKGYKSADEIEEAFKDAVLLEVCNAAAGWADVEAFISDFGEDAGVDMGAYDDLSETDKNKLYLSILNRGDFDNIEAFAEFANKEIDDLDDDPQGGGRPSGGGGGYGGGGSGSGGGTTGGTTVSTPIVSADTPNENPTQPEAPAFTDMTGYEWAKESVEALAEKGIVTGTGEGAFEPGRNVNREEMLVMILRSFDVEPGETKTDFTDAEADGWYNEYLAAAKEAGYVNGRPDGSFGVGEAVTREDAAVMAYNIAKAMGEEFDTSVSETFTDDEEVSEYAKEAVYALKNKGVINGKEEGVFAPKDNCTRAEAAKIIYTLIAE